MKDGTKHKINAAILTYGPHVVGFFLYLIAGLLLYGCAILLAYVSTGDVQEIPAWLFIPWVVILVLIFNRMFDHFDDLKGWIRRWLERPRGRVARKNAILEAMRHHEWMTASDIAYESKIGVGALYPDLARLEQSGMVISKWQPEHKGLDGSDVPRRRLYCRVPVPDPQDDGY